MIDQITFPIKTRENAAEIAHLIRDGTPESRKKARELFQSAVNAAKDKPKENE